MRSLVHRSYSLAVAAFNRENLAFRGDALCRRIGEVEGNGPVTATAVVAAIVNGSTFQNGRQFAAWLGLVPRQHSSGDKQKLLTSLTTEHHPGRRQKSRGHAGAVESVESPKQASASFHEPLGNLYASD